MHHFKLTRVWALLLLVALGGAGTQVRAAESPAKDFPVVFKEMGVVQNKAMNKHGRFLFAPSFAVDFSDGPYSMFALGARVGYAVSDFWEVYLLANPKFINQKRPFIKNLEEQVASGGYTVDLSGAVAQSEYGVQILWAPLYGKDSLGISRIIRSDTFLRLGVSSINYDLGSGLKLGLGVGKTFFLGKNWGVRVLVEEALTQTINQNVKEFSPITYVESGLTFYY
jgi:outer membrane beta-barrel protein